MIAETLITHASDSLECVEGSGLIETRTTVVNGAPQVVTRAIDGAPLRLPPRAALSEAPRDLTTVARDGRLILWRRRPAELMRVVDGEASEADLVPPAEPPYAVAGRLSFGPLYLPRLFSVSAGGAAGHIINVYASPLGVRPDAGGVISARLFFGSDPASFALVTVRVALPTADPTHTADRTYRGQADARGELRLALTGLPAPTRAMIEADDLDRTATITVAADPALSGAEAVDPDALPAANLVGPDAPGAAPSQDFTIRPGGIIRLTSAGADHLSLTP